MHKEKPTIWDEVKEERRKAGHRAGYGSQYIWGKVDLVGVGKPELFG